MQQNQSTFTTMKTVFKQETGLDADKHIDTYIAYYNAKTNTTISELLVHVANSFKIIEGLASQMKLNNATK